MFAEIVHICTVVIYDPLYNGLMGLMDIFPWMDVGLAIIVFTIIVRLILFPISRLSIKTQIRMREVQPELASLQKKYPKREEQALKMMELYRRHNIRPFAGTLLLFIQLPILFGLYYVFARSGLPSVNTAILYPFIHAPAIDMQFLGLNIADGSIIMAFIAALSQYLQLRFSLAGQPAPGVAADNPAVAMSRNMRYFMPAMIFVLAFRFPAAISLYWAVGNLFMLGQELFVRYHHQKDKGKTGVMKI